MEIHDASELMRRAAKPADGATVGQLHPAGRSENSLVAVDLWELEPGRSTAPTATPEEQIVFVLSGSGELAGASGRAGALRLQPNSIVRVDQNETHSFHNTGSEPLRLLVIVPLVAWSARALGVPSEQGSTGQPDGAPMPAQTPAPVEEEKRPARLREAAPSDDEELLAQTAARRPGAEATQRAVPEEQEAPPPDISGLVKRASELPVGAARPERRKPAPEPESAPANEAQQEEEEAPSNLMELLAVFDGGSRGNPGQGYGSYLVQSPNRKPVIKRVEFGDNYTNNQAEYDSLIACLNYIIERLEATSRSPSMVQLEVKTDSDLVANQLLGNFKVKDAGLRKRHAQALELLDRFANWSIQWQPREETVRLLGH